MKIKYYHLVIFSFFTAALLIMAFSPQEETKDVSHKKLIKFSHQFHIENDAYCDDCHTKAPNAEDLSASLLPTMDACAGCHDVEDDNECSTCHYEDIYEPFSEEEEETDEIIFSHKFHVSENETECIVCHKGLNKVDYAFESGTSIPNMATCTSCHNDKSVATIECGVCHTKTDELLPESHKLASFENNHAFSASNGNSDCAVCHNNNFCEACHSATVMITEANTAKDFYTPYSPFKYKENAKVQQITLVHELNYRYSHGIDAKGKEAKCQTCHSLETFCSECHNAEGTGDYAMGGFVPYSHTQPNFTTIGVGTGGGEHATLAKRDIESCTACHDINGGDPNCILCHNDPDGIKGTNPKTHDLGFMKDVQGDWHDDPGSVCFTCHNNTNTAGIGFCGYCHSSNAN